jgi:hypothetical protein
LDYLMEKGQVKAASVVEDWDSFHVNILCPKFAPDAPPAAPKPKPRPVAPPPKPRKFHL